MYKYTLLKQDGGEIEIGIGKRKDFKELRKILDCQIIEIIPKDYYDGKGTCYGDEEGGFNENNHRNPHFKVIKDLWDDEWDVVGDIIKEEKVIPNK